MQAVQLLQRVGQALKVEVAHVNDTTSFWHLDCLGVSLDNLLYELPNPDHLRVLILVV